jgi:hypothetical protein
MIPGRQDFVRWMPDGSIIFIPGSGGKEILNPYT